MNYPVLVSAVMATNRVDHNFYSAISSLLSLSLDSLEVIVVLDGLKRSRVSPDLLRHVVLRETGQHVGTAAALNQGVEMASGEFIVRLDADDICVPGRIEEQVRYLQEHVGVSAVGGQASIINAAGRKIGDMPVQGPFEMDLRRHLLLRNRFVHSTMCIRRSALTAIGGYNEHCIRKQDYELWLRIGATGELHLLPVQAAEYRVHENQSSRRSPVISRSTVEITKARFRLASIVRVSRVKTLTYSLLWIGWQTLRQIPAVKPSYKRHLSDASG